MADLIDRLNTARIHALNGGVPMRRTDAALYTLMAECLAIIEDVERDNLHDELRSAIKVDGVGLAGRRYVESKADASIMVCRYVLAGNDTRNSTYRYALSLREARRRQIRSDTLTDWLRSNGGINTLYKTRSTETKSNIVRTLHLNAPVTVTPGEWLNIRIRRDPRGFFDVAIISP